MEAYKQSVDTVTKEVSVNTETGLTQQEAQQRLKENGRNQFEEAKKDSVLKKFIHSLSDFTTIILLVAAAISFYTAIVTEHGEYFEGILIIAIVIINAVLAIVQEGNAEKSLAALQDMNKQSSAVLRDGKVIEVDAEELVVGDVLVLEAGSMITADARLIQASQMRVEESALTGESEPVEKDPTYVGHDDDGLGDQINMIFKGCTVVNGRGRAVVTAT
ncbi:MAG: HAD-IC family P-type ATPase, partial [Enterococcus faecalis]|nr:HAD-IC family P-type ATPase [Enterococcus faecalis]